MPFEVNKCHILKVRTRNKKKYEYKISGVTLESVQCVKGLGITIESNLKFSQHYREAACKANRMLAFIKNIFFFQE